MLLTRAIGYLGYCTRLIVCSALSIGILLTLNTATAQPPSEINGKIEIWSWNIAAASLQKLIPPFQQRYPHVDARVTMNGTNMQSRFLLSLSAGVGAPDVSQLQLTDALFYAQTGRLTDLTAVATKYKDQFPASFWGNCVNDGKVYAIPWDMGPCAVFYKRHIFTQYGIDPDTIETWADYINVGKQILAKSGGKTRMLFLPTGQLEGMFEIILQQTGGQIFDAEGRVAINSPQVLQTLEVLRAMLASGIGYNASAGSHAYYASLKTDSVATYPGATWLGGLMTDHAPETKGDWGVFRLPAVTPGGLRTSNYGGSVLVIPEQSKNHAAAWAFIEYALCTREGQLAQYRNFDLFPALLSTHGDPFFDEPVPFFDNQKTRRLFAQDIEKIPALNRTTDWLEAIRYVREAMSTWASGDMQDTQTLLENLEKKIARRTGRSTVPKGNAP